MNLDEETVQGKIDNAKKNMEEYQRKLDEDENLDEKNKQLIQTLIGVYETQIEMLEEGLEHMKNGELK